MTGLDWLLLSVVIVPVACTVMIIRVISSHGSAQEVYADKVCRAINELKAVMKEYR